MLTFLSQPIPTFPPPARTQYPTTRSYHPISLHRSSYPAGRFPQKSRETLTPEPQSRKRSIPLLSSFRRTPTTPLQQRHKDLRILGSWRFSWRSTKPLEASLCSSSPLPLPFWPWKWVEIFDSSPHGDRRQKATERSSDDAVRTQDKRRM